MSVTIDLPPEIEESLKAQAEARGMPLADHLRQVLEAHAGASKTRRKALEDRIKSWRDVSELPETKPLSDEAVSRESIYNEREADGALAVELLALGRDCAARLKEPWKSAAHAALLYDERGHRR
jgi:hypothetical protein